MGHWSALPSRWSEHTIVRQIICVEPCPKRRYRPSAQSFAEIRSKVGRRDYMSI